MNSEELLRIVDVIHRDRGLDKEIVFQGLEAALSAAAKRHYGEDVQVVIRIDRKTGELSGECDDVEMDPREISERIAAQTARQVMIQKIREAERDAIYDEYQSQRNQMVVGTVQRYEGGAVTVALSDVEAILPRNEQMPGERYEQNARLRATIFEVKKQGSRVRVVLSRIRPHLVQRLFEQEIPEIADGVIEIRSISREAGYRTKIAVWSSDPRVDCVGACVGIRGSRIRGIHEELGGERIDVIPWDEDPLVFISNSLKPAEVDEVILCQMLGRAIVLVREDQLSLAIGRYGQNVWLASKLCGWDIDIMTRDELDADLTRAITNFSSIEGVAEELAEQLVGEGFLSYADLSVIEPEDLMEMGGLSEEEVSHIVTQAEEHAEEEERAVEEERKRRKEQRKVSRSGGATRSTATSRDATADAESVGNNGSVDHGVESRGVESSGVESNRVESGGAEHSAETGKDGSEGKTDLGSVIEEPVSFVEGSVSAEVDPMGVGPEQTFDGSSGSSSSEVSETGKPAEESSGDVAVGHDATADGTSVGE